MKPELVGDWEREIDNVVDGIWEFKASREVEEDLEKYLEHQDIHKLRLMYQVAGKENITDTMHSLEPWTTLNQH